MIKESISEKSGSGGRDKMEYLSSVFGPSNQARADETPVTGGGLRFYNEFLNYSSTRFTLWFNFVGSEM